MAGFDNHWGKYDGPLAALCERWSMDGEQGDDYYSDPEGDGSGCILWRATRRREDGTWEMASGPFALTFGEYGYLRDEFGLTAEEATELDKELRSAQGILFSWDSQGFLYGYISTTVDETEGIARTIADDNAKLGEGE